MKTLKPWQYYIRNQNTKSLEIWFQVYTQYNQHYILSDFEMTIFIYSKYGQQAHAKGNLLISLLFLNFMIQDHKL